ncbi:unnamed protein product [Schistosoma curassoni]|uniref:Transposase n=1 Tax=Schistosoma curassoni TaxID=6186 RepID=A0A183KQW0_9TREM|nr:unnamed protein product [Schistosoma curassoni]
MAKNIKPLDRPVKIIANEDDDSCKFHSFILSFNDFNFDNVLDLIGFIGDILSDH